MGLGAAEGNGDGADHGSRSGDPGGRAGRGGDPGGVVSRSGEGVRKRAELWTTPARESRNSWNSCATAGGTETGRGTTLLGVGAGASGSSSLSSGTR